MISERIVIFSKTTVSVSSNSMYLLGTPYFLRISSNFPKKAKSCKYALERFTEITIGFIPLSIHCLKR